MLYRLNLLGGFSLFDTCGRELRVSSKRGKALLAMLALRRGGASRAWLQNCLWPDRMEEQASNSLRQLLHTLRKELGSTGDPPLLISFRDQIRLDPDRISVDILEIDERLGRGTSIDPGPSCLLLEGLDLAGAEPFEEWLTRNRQWAEDIVQRARRASAAAGHASPEAAQPAPKATQSPGIRPTIAIDYREDHARPDWPALAALLAEALRRQTSVLLVHSSQPGNGPEPTYRLVLLPHLAEPPRLQDAGAWLQLYCSNSNELLWSEHLPIVYGADRAAALSAMEPVSVQIDSVVERHLRRDSIQTADDPSEIRAKYWRANQLVRHWTKAATEEALRLSRDVLEARPHDDWAKAQLALCEAIMAFQNWCDDPHMASGRAVAIARACVSSGQDDPYALGTAAIAMVLAGQSPENARPIIEHALQLNPHMPGTWFWLGWASLAGGHLDRAREAFSHAISLNPQLAVRPYALAGLGLAHLLEASPQQAEPLLLEACALLEAFGPALAGAAIVSADAGRRAEARHYLDRLAAAGGAGVAIGILRHPEHRRLITALLDGIS